MEVRVMDTCRRCVLVLAVLLLGCATPTHTFKVCGEVCTRGVQHVSASWDESRCVCVTSAQPESR